jgi:outer membrane protein assembly factor BamB
MLGLAQGQNWPRFRGPNGEGIDEAANIPAHWTADDYRWRIQLSGVGYSSPVVWGERVFVTSALEEDGRQLVHCRSAVDGHQYWRREFPASTYAKSHLNSYASPTPAVDADRLYCSWATPREYNVAALDHRTGDVLWRRDLGPFQSQHGPGASLMVVGDLVVVPNDQDGESSVVALEAKTGRTRWTAARHRNLAGYSTPFLFQPNGAAAQLILTSRAHGITSLQPQTGNPNWELDVLDSRVVGSGVAVSGLIVAGCGGGGIGTRMVAVRPAVPDRRPKPEIAYQVPKGAIPYVPTPVTCGPLLFLWFDRGIVSCLDGASGEVHWRERVGGEFFGSPVRVADRLYCISRSGDVYVVAASEQFKLLGKVSLGERSHSTPAVAGGRMYLRTVSHLMAVGG